MSNGIICKYCGKTLSNKNNLSQHYKSLACQKQRGVKEQSEHTCPYCDKEFSRKTNLTRHLELCTEKKVFETKEKYKACLKKERERVLKLESKTRGLEKRIKYLEKTNRELIKELDEHKGIVKGMEKAPVKKTIYNTAIHPKLVNLPISNIPALTHEYIIEKVNDGILTYEKATKGYRGMLEVICDLITHENESGEIERNYVCTDVSRNSFHRLLESKKWKSDKGGRYLNNMLNTFRDVMEEYKNKAYDIYNQTPHDSIEWDQVDWERKNISLLYSGIIDKESSKSREELVNILRKEISKRASV